MTAVEGFEAGEIHILGGRSIPRMVVGVGLSGLEQDIYCPGLAGLDGEHVLLVVAQVAVELGADADLRTTEIGGIGTVRLQPVHGSWSNLAWPFTSPNDLGVQIVPTDPLWRTIDSPDMSTQWVDRVGWPWSRLGSPDLVERETETVVTNLDAMRGLAVTEAARYEDGAFEFLAVVGDQPDNRDGEYWVVPIDVLVDCDASLEPLRNTPPGCSWWRSDGDSPWQRWQGWSRT